MDIPNEKLADFLNIMEQACTRLEKYQSLPVKEYDESWEIQDIIERELQQGIQASMDAAMRLITLKNYGHPDDHKGLFDILVQNRIISYEFSDKMKDLVGFRNILVHEYFRVDPRKVYEHLRSDPPIIREFAKYLVEFLEKIK